MPDYACADWLTEDGLRALLDSPPAAFEWMILEAVDEVVFNPFEQAIDVGSVDAGRVFGPDCEVRWQRDGDLFHTLLVGSLAQPSPVLSAHQQDLSAPEFDRIEREYFLWGEWSRNIPEWVEAAIPHIFNYPPPPQPGRWRRKLTSVEYVNQHTGEMEFYRFAGAASEQIAEEL